MPQAPGLDKDRADVRGRTCSAPSGWPWPSSWPCASWRRAAALGDHVAENVELGECAPQRAGHTRDVGRVARPYQVRARADLHALERRALVEGDQGMTALVDRVAPLGLFAAAMAAERMRAKEIESQRPGFADDGWIARPDVALDRVGYELVVAHHGAVPGVTCTFVTTVAARIVAMLVGATASGAVFVGLAEKPNVRLCTS